MRHNSLLLLFFSKSELFNQSAREYMKDHKQEDMIDHRSQLYTQLKQLWN